MKHLEASFSLCHVTVGVLNHASDQCFESFLLRDLAKLRNVCFASAILGNYDMTRRASSAYLNSRIVGN